MRFLLYNLGQIQELLGNPLPWSSARFMNLYHECNLGLNILVLTWKKNRQLPAILSNSLHSPSLSQCLKQQTAWLKGLLHLRLGIDNAAERCERNGTIPMVSKCSACHGRCLDLGMAQTWATWLKPQLSNRQSNFLRCVPIIYIVYKYMLSIMCMYIYIYTYICICIYIYIHIISKIVNIYIYNLH